MEEFKEDKWINEILEKDVDIWEYAIESQKKLNIAENQLVSDFIKFMPNILELNENVEKCDKILYTISNSLEQFKSNLSELNGAISSLQNQSKVIQVKLKNRMQVHTRLNKSINYLSIDPRTINIIVNEEINEDYVSHVLKIDLKMEFIQQKSGNKNSHVKAIKEVSPELDKLRYKASAKIREYFVQQIKQIEILWNEKKTIDLQSIQKNQFLKYKKLIPFLIKRNLSVILEIIQYYINSLSLYYLNCWDPYLKFLNTCFSSLSSSKDLLGYDGSVKKGFMDFSIFSTTNTINSNSINKYNLYQLGNRDKVLQFNEDYECITMNQHDNNNVYKIEDLFKSINVTFLSCIMNEYLFLKEFISNSSTIYNKQKEIINELNINHIIKSIFEFIIKKIHTIIKQHLEISCDTIGILLCIRLNQQYFNIVKSMKMEFILINYINTNEQLFWLKFQNLINLHIQSLKKATNQVIINEKTHFISKRYAELIGSILILCYNYNESMLLNGILRLRIEYFNWLDKVKFQQDKKKEIFQINNFYLILNILNEYNNNYFHYQSNNNNNNNNNSNGNYNLNNNNLNNNLNNNDNDNNNNNNTISMTNEHIEKEIDIIKEKYKLVLNEYIIQLLEPYFQQIIHIEENSNLVSTQHNQEYYNRILIEFNNKYKTYLELIYKEIQTTFNNELKENFSSILHSTLAHLILCYTKFIAFIDQHFPKLNREVLSVNLLILEVKKYR
ncbi:Vps52-domain-containing protein [Neoconidiobolus thromboides FSU 785]|nr:Vps52-domain-containing protein [Neoconidiobolus thromboides FSU 785]